MEYNKKKEESGRKRFFVALFTQISLAGELAGERTKLNELLQLRSSAARVSEENDSIESLTIDPFSSISPWQGKQQGNYS